MRVIRIDDGRWWVWTTTTTWGMFWVAPPTLFDPKGGVTYLSNYSSKNFSTNKNTKFGNSLLVGNRCLENQFRELWCYLHEIWAKNYLKESKWKSLCICARKTSREQINFVFSHSLVFDNFWNIFHVLHIIWCARLMSHGAHWI